MRKRISLLTLLLLGIALAGAPAAVGNSQDARSGEQVEQVEPFGVPLEEFDASSGTQAKAGQTPVDPQVVFETDYVLGAGTGGGDLVESEPNDTFETADVAPDLPFNCTGTISSSGDWDHLTFEVTAGQPLQVTVFSRLPGGINSPLDPMVHVGFATELIAGNDNATPGNVNSQVNFVTPHAGTLYVQIVAAGGAGPSSDYVVSVLPVTGNAFAPANYESEPNDDLDGADPIVPPGVKIGVIPDDDDADFTYVDAPAGATLVVDVSARVFGYPTDPIVVLWRQDGRGLFGSYNVDGVDPRFNIRIPVTGRYFLMVRAPQSGSSTSIYMLSVTLQDGAASPAVTSLKLAGKKLKKVVGSGFDPTGMVVEIDGAVVPSVPSPKSPTTVIKVKPPVRLRTNDVVTVMRPNGRRSNPVVYE